MCNLIILEYTCGHDQRVSNKCEHRRKEAESCWYSCFGGGRCDGRNVPERRVQGGLCQNCSYRRARTTQAGHAGVATARKTKNNQSNNAKDWARPSARASFMPPSLGRDLVGLPGSEYDAVYDPRRRAPANSNSNNTNAPYYQQRGNGKPNQVTRGGARPLSHFPSIQQVPSAQRPQVQYQPYKMPESMRAEPMMMRRGPQLPAIKTVPKPQMAKVVNPGTIHMPHSVQIVDQSAHAHQPQAAHIISPTYTYDQRLKRRDSNGVSELGSDDGNSPTWRPQVVSPQLEKQMSILHQRR